MALLSSRYHQDWGFCEKLVSKIRILVSSASAWAPPIGGNTEYPEAFDDHVYFNSIERLFKDYFVIFLLLQVHMCK